MKRIKEAEEIEAQKHMFMDKFQEAEETILHLHLQCQDLLVNKSADSHAISNAHEELCWKEWSSLEDHHRLLELAQKTGVALPDHVRPSFLTKPPLESKMTKWIGNLEFEWQSGEETWVRWQKCCLDAWHSGNFGKFTEIIEHIWGNDRQWKKSVRHLLPEEKDPHSMCCDSTCTLTEFGWFLEDGGHWAEHHKQFFDENIA